MALFTDKTILVVGGSSGIGLEVVRQLALAGANVVVASRKPSPALADLQIQHLEVDVTEPVEAALGNIPVLHGLAYCPGSINLKPFHRLKEEEFRADFEVNVLGAVKVLQAVLKPLKKAEGASVVLYSSVAATTGMSFHASIATAKAALEGLGRSLAAELAPNQIRVNVLAPSLTDTPLAKNLLDTEEKRTMGNKRHPLGRVGQPGDLASLTCFLLSTEATWITGQVIGVDGGMGNARMF